MYAIVYEWRVPPEREQEFVEEWTRATRSIREHCGSFGSRLHQTEDGRWVAYARWPSLEAQAACTPGTVPQLEPLAEPFAGLGTLVHRMRIVRDLLDEPAEGGPE